MAFETDTIATLAIANPGTGRRWEKESLTSPGALAVEEGRPRP
jgi:hypothetical protein